MAISQNILEARKRGATDDMILYEVLKQSTNPGKVAAVNEAKSRGASSTQILTKIMKDNPVIVQEDVPPVRTAVEQPAVEKIGGIDPALRKQLEESGDMETIKELENYEKKTGVLSKMPLETIKAIKTVLVDPVARAMMRSPHEMVKGIQALVPGGKTGLEPTKTPFGEMKPVLVPVREGQVVEGAKPWELLGEAFEAAVTLFPGFKGKGKTAEEAASGLVNRIMQAGNDKYDIKQAKKALSGLDVSKVKTYEDLKNLALKKIKVLSEQMDKYLESFPGVTKLKEFVIKTPVGKKKVKTNFVQIAIRGLKELYKTTFDLPALERIGQLEQKAVKEGLSIKEINNLAKEWNVDFHAKAFVKKTGEALTSVSAQKYENIRKGVKESYRKLLPDKTAKALDTEITNLYTVKRLAQNMEKKVDNLAQKFDERGLFEKVIKKVGKVVDVVTLGATGKVRQLFSRFLIESNIGNKTPNSIAIQEQLSKRLKELEKLSKDDDIIEYLSARILEAPQLFKSIVRSTAYDIKEGVNGLVEKTTEIANEPK